MRYLELTKPNVTWLLLMSAAAGYLFGARHWDWALFFHMLAGTALLASGTAALNEWCERDLDGKMLRTRERPIPSGRIAPDYALAAGVALSAAGFGELAFAVNRVAALIGLAALSVYLFVYTPLKLRSGLATAVGAITGAAPPLVGFAAARGIVNAEAWGLFAIIFLWQLPHSLAIAWINGYDYRKVGIRSLPAIDPGDRLIARRILAGTLLLVPATLAFALFEVMGTKYLVGAAALGGALVYSAACAARERTDYAARCVLLASVAYLPLLFALMIVDGPLAWGLK